MGAQSKLISLVEAGTNTTVGWAISVAIGQLVYPWLIGFCSFIWHYRAKTITYSHTDR